MYTIHVGFSGFPTGMASVQRTLLTFKGLSLAGATPLIINKISHHQLSDNKTVKHFEGIAYANTAFYKSKPLEIIRKCPGNLPSIPKIKCQSRMCRGVDQH